MQLNPDYPDFHPEYPGTPYLEYPELYPEYPDIRVTFTLFPPTKCKNPFKSMNGMMHNAWSSYGNLSAPTQQSSYNSNISYIGLLRLTPAHTTK